jgi:hypothetical protein
MTPEHLKLYDENMKRLFKELEQLSERVAAE